jgi:phenylalanyl-tRNA synthetase beta chain
MQNEHTASLQLFSGKQQLGELSEISPKQMSTWDIKQPVYFAQIEVAALLKAVRKSPVVYQEIPKFPSVQRDVAMIIDRKITYSRVEEVIQQTNLRKLKSTRLFDVFESDKLGQGKKSIAISCTFQDVEKTLTDKEIDSMMNKLMQQLEQQLQAEIRKA